MSNVKPTSVCLDSWQQHALSRHAAKLDRSVSWLVNTAVTIYLREQGYSRIDHQPELVSVPAQPALSRGVAPTENAPAAAIAAPDPVLPGTEPEAIVERPKAPSKKKPSGGWTPERKWKQENLRRRRAGMRQLSLEDYLAANPQ
jgi:hypothetical protein